LPAPNIGPGHISFSSLGLAEDLHDSSSRATRYLEPLFTIPSPSLEMLPQIGAILSNSLPSQPVSSLSPPSRFPCDFLILLPCLAWVTALRWKADHLLDLISVTYIPLLTPDGRCPELLKNLYAVSLSETFVRKSSSLSSPVWREIRVAHPSLERPNAPRTPQPPSSALFPPSI